MHKGKCSLGEAYKGFSIKKKTKKKNAFLKEKPIKSFFSIKTLSWCVFSLVSSKKIFMYAFFMRRNSIKSYVKLWIHKDEKMFHKDIFLYECHKGDFKLCGSKNLKVFMWSLYGFLALFSLWDWKGPIKDSFMGPDVLV